MFLSDKLYFKILKSSHVFLYTHNKVQPQTKHLKNTFIL